MTNNWKERPIEVLLVEDNQDDVELTLFALEEQGLKNKIKVVGDGAEALSFLWCTDQYAHRNPNQNPKLILLDLKLPKVDGLEVLEFLKSDPRTQLLPVVILTSSRDIQDVTKGYTLGTNSYIVKPVDYDKFTAAVQELSLYWLGLNQPPYF
ncbi:MAG: response regulator [Symploca sp. SIO2E9]|nr:response regulator [Symploca sp. SIO2E9]